MGGYSSNREQNYEIKYLRKALLRVDSRIQVPESIGAESLRRLLDDVEQPVIRDSARRIRPRWLSLQSGIAYAAAFVLIVALFYSTRLYSPNMIDGVLPVAEQQGSDIAAPAASAIDAILANQEEAAADSPRQDSQTQPAEPQTPDASAKDESTTSDLPYAVGGSGIATLLLENDQVAYYWRLNDATDPDRAGVPCTLEIIDGSTERIASQIDYEEIQSIVSLFLTGDRLVVIGASDEGGSNLYIYVYNAADPLNPVEMSRQLQSGIFADAKAYKDIVYVASVSGEPFGEVEPLPDSDGEDVYYVIGALSPAEPKSYTKSFAGADGTIQLHSLNAYIRYTGADGDGNKKEYIAQINLDDLNIGLGTVS